MLTLHMHIYLFKSERTFTNKEKEFHCSIFQNILTNAFINKWFKTVSRSSIHVHVLTNVDAKCLHISRTIAIRN